MISSNRRCLARSLHQYGRRMSAEAKYPVTAAIQTKLSTQLKPLHLQVMNESHMHNVWVSVSSLSGGIRSVLGRYIPCLTFLFAFCWNRPKNSETHFKVVIVSEEFATLATPLARHRRVNAILKEELDGPVHALSIAAKTPAQWQTMMETGQSIEPSPACRGGDGSLPPKSPGEHSST